MFRDASTENSEKNQILFGMTFQRKLSIYLLLFALPKIHFLKNSSGMHLFIHSLY